MSKHSPKKLAFTERSRRGDRIFIILLIAIALCVGLLRYLQYKRLLPVIYHPRRRLSRWNVFTHGARDSAGASRKGDYFAAAFLHTVPQKKG